MGTSDAKNINLSSSKTMFCTEEDHSRDCFDSDVEFEIIDEKVRQQVGNDEGQLHLHDDSF